jgi:diketogulonate reductase-like aldo/keto reductase
MSHDGCEEVAWKGQAFPYLMHHPRQDTNDSYGKERARAAAAGGGGHGNNHAAAAAGGAAPDTLRRAGTGTWNGPAPVSLAAETAACAAATAANAAAAAAVAAASEPRFLGLPGGARLPVLGLGTYKIASPGAIVSALKLGYRHLDCASFYDNQAVVGEGIRAFLALPPAEQRAAEGEGAEPSALERATRSAADARASASAPVSRADLFVTTKIWNTEHRPADAVASVERSLADLGLDYVDCVLVHWPEAWLPGSDIRAPETIVPDTEVTLLETWRALEGLVASGKARCLGLSNASLAQVEGVLADVAARGAAGAAGAGAAGVGGLRPGQQVAVAPAAAATTTAAASSPHPAVRPAVVHAELHVLMPQRKLVGVLRRKGVACVAHSPLGSHKSRAALDHPAVVRVAARLGKTPAQVLLRYNAQRGVAVIPKAEGAGRQAENARGVFGGWRLDDDAKAELDAIVPSDASGQRAIDYPWKDWGDLEAGGVPKPSLCAALRGMTVA